MIVIMGSGMNCVFKGFGLPRLGLGFRFQDLEYRLQGLGCRFEERLGLGAQALRFWAECRIQFFGFRM